MLKSMSKKFLIFLFVAVASLCSCIPCLTWQKAKADRVVYETGGQTVDSSTSKADVESRISELADGVDYYTAQIALINSDVVVDEDGKAFKRMKERTLEEFDDGNFSFVEGSLYGNYGLNGILGIYEVAYEFVSEYVFVDTTDGNVFTSAGLRESLDLSVDTLLRDLATKHVTGEIGNKAFTAELFKNDQSEGSASLPYKKERADAWVEDFVANETNGLAFVKKAQEELNLFVEQNEKRLDYVKSYYFSDKYLVSYVNQEVYQSETDVSEEELAKVKEEIVQILTVTTDLETVKTSIKQIVKDYEALFADLKTALERTYEEVHALADLSSEQAEETLVLIAKCEDAFKLFESLGTVNGIVLSTDGEYHETEIDLKSGNPVGLENANLGDLKVASTLMNEYRALVKRAIGEAESALEGQYGVSSEKLTSAYVNYAKGLADCLTGYFGKLTPEGESAPVCNGYSANQYSYVNAEGETVTVVYGSDIVNAFKASPFCNGALVVTDNGNRKESTALDEFKLKSTVVDSSNPNYVISITRIDQDGNEIDCFNSDAVLVAREGASPSVERNLYLILKGERLERGTQGLSEEVANYLNGRVLKYYFTFTISSSTLKDGKLSVLEFDEPITVKITIKFNKPEEFEAVKGKTCAFSYCHTNVGTVYSDIEWGDSTMTFNVSNFTNQAQIAMATEGKASFDWPKYIILGLLGLVVLLFLIWILVAVIRNWKYKIIFNANGGKYNSCIKVKLHEKFNHPAPPYRKGYKFLGWFADSKCTVRFAASELTKRHKVKVYAKWMSNEEYEKLNEQFAGATVSTGVGAMWMDPSLNVRRDANIEKIEAEKLGYEAKKAEEERKTEEVKLQAIREIDEAKKNDEARAKAEQEAEEAKAKLEESLAERDELIKRERADERAKCIEEMKSASVDGDVDYEAAIAKAKAETEEKLRKEFDEESKARAEEQAKVNEELLNKIKALEEANNKEDDEEKLNAAIAAGVALKLAEMAKEEKPEPEVEVTPEVSKPIEEPVVAFDTVHVFDELKAEIYSYADADDLGYGLEVSVPACAMKVVEDKIELEVNLDLEDCAKKGYKVVKGEKLAVKFVLSSEDDVDEAEELIAETMLVNGLKKVQRAVITSATEETRQEGFEHGVSKERLADTPEEFYKLLRVHAKSYVYADDAEVEEKLLMKMFLRRNRVYLYLNYSAEGLKACDAEMASAGLKTFMTVKNVEDCKEAVKLISQMMKENGLIRYPSEAKIAEEDCVKGFTYVLSK
ncbi:MAG: InlB B-repeat-containing protein [Clostridia bacterium]|nr:InlB B-repeat-containing protein [Clostridia bacterium]